MAPIDPAQLLKALENLLSEGGGIKSTEDVPRLVSLMKKFSKKLVSRCVYCNVLQSTDINILSEYLDRGGWETINTWLQFAKSTPSPSFLVEMLKLCKMLPMTVSRLKENNTPKLIKSLTKHENDDVKALSTELVTKWMTIIKGQKAEVPVVEKKKKKDKEKDKEKEKEKPKPIEEKKVEVRKSPRSEKVEPDPPKSPAKLKSLKRPSSEKEAKIPDYNEDVKIEPLLPVTKKPRADRPKTAKIYNQKFRSTGLEEVMPLPKKIPKKTSTIDKSSAVAAAKNALKQNPVVLPERVTERKINPETLASVNENTAINKGIKLIAPKPRPTYMLHESASFMDALTSQPVVAIKKRKKTTPPSKSATSPTSPTIAAPKLQFYKDTLEMNESPKKEESEEENISCENANEKEEAVKREETKEVEAAIVQESSVVVAACEEQPMEVDKPEENGGNTPPIQDSDQSSRPTGDAEDFTGMTNEPFDPNNLRSILSHGRRRSAKKTVRWVRDECIKEVFYFEMDETERVNVLKAQNFGDMKSIELKREREALEQAKRAAGDRMDEQTRWWFVPIPIDAPPPLIETGCYSKEKEVERLRQQSTLQEIYFTKEMIPDSPHEPDLEIVANQEPKVIPLDEENTLGSFTDYSNYTIPKPVQSSLPDVLSTLMKMKSNLPLPILSPNHNTDQGPIDMKPNILPHMSPDATNHHTYPMSMNSPYDPGEPVNNMPPNSLLGPHPPIHPPNMYGMSSPPMSEPLPNHGPPPPQNEWRTLDMIQDQYQYGNYPTQQGPPPPHGGNMLPPDPGPGMNMRPRIMQDNFRPNPHHNKGPPPRGMGPPRPPRNIHRVPCRHFVAGGCRFGMKCSFLHPGINGPRL